MSRAPHPVTALLVDWNGTMVDDINRARQATERALAAVNEAHRAPRTAAEFRAAFTLPMQVYFRQLGVPGERVASTVLEWNRVMATIPAVLAPGARRLLDAAHRRDIPVHVLSGAHEHVINNDCSELGVSHLIAGVHADTHPKRAVLAQYAACGPTIYIGDTRYDVHEGLAAGVRTFAVGFGYGYRGDLGDAERIVDDLGDIAELLGQ